MNSVKTFLLLSCASLVGALQARALHWHVMICLEPGLYLRVQELSDRAHPFPLPLQSGFSMATAYRALGVYSPSETGESYFILANDRDEIWFISNRHLRVVGLFPERSDLRYSLAD